ncbi:MAG: hypothetical protein AAGB93_11325 [Planctomycetota bacterium]
MRSFSIGSAFALAIAFAPQSAAQTFDDFESYAPGTPIEGQNDWQNWVCGANQAINTVETVPAASGTKALRVAGGSDTVNTFGGIITSGLWTLSIQTFVPNAFLGDTYIILMNQWDCPGNYNWSAQTFFDSGTATFRADQFTVTNQQIFAGDVPIVFDQWVEVRYEIDLNNDLVSIYYNCEKMYTYTWSSFGTDGLPQLAALDLFPIDANVTEVFYDDVRLTPGLFSTCSIGTNYCMANANSTGQMGEMSASGTPVVSSNDLTLTAGNLPNGAFGFFITSQIQGFVPNPAGSAGNLCLTGAIGRYVGPGQIQNTGPAGEYSLTIDLTQVPTPNGLVPVVAGETWNFQGWHRDSSPSGPTSNFTDGLSILFL